MMNPLPRSTLIPLTKDIVSREILAEKDKDSVKWEKYFSKLEVSLTW